MKLPKKTNAKRWIGLAMVTTTVSLAGLVAFRALDAHDNSKVAREATLEPAVSQVATIESTADLDTAVAEIETLEFDGLDASLDEEFDF